MQIPDFQTIMLPFLKNLKDGNQQSINKMMEDLSTYFKLTEEDLSIRVPSGQMGLFRNRVGWTRSYLKNAGLISYPERGVYQITQTGQDFLKTNPKQLRMKELLQFPKYNEWRATFGQSNEINESVSKTEKENTATPLEQLDATIKTLHEQLASDILDSLKENSPKYFEKFVLDLLQAMGYGGFSKDSAVVTGQTNDGGIDGIIYQDRLGLEAIYVQAKRFASGSVGSPDIRNFIGSLALKGVTKGVFLTTSIFSQEAKKNASDSKQQKIILIDGLELTKLAIEYNVGVQIEKTIYLKRLDTDFFEEI